MERKLGADDLRSLFADLAQELALRNVRGEVHLAGGAAMSLEYNSDLLSGDADAQFAPDGPMIEAINAVAVKRGLSRSWLNNQASVYFSPLAQPGKTVFEHRHLVVMVTPPEHLASMKILAARSTRDRDDLLLLIARNQIEMLDALAGDEATRLLAADIARARRNLTDRISRPAA